MDRIFGEIKRAIEEELAQQESTRRPGQRGMSQRQRPPARDIPPEQRWPDEQRAEPWDGHSEARDAEDAARIEAERRREHQRELERTGSSSQQTDTRAARQAAHASKRREQLLKESSGDADRRRRGRSGEARLDRSNPLRAFIRQSFNSSDGVRRAILMSEIFGRPVSMRRADDHLP